MKKIILLLIAYSLSFGLWAYDFSVGGSYYSFNLDKTTVGITNDGSGAGGTGGANYSGDLTIPLNVTYSGIIYSVTSISEYAFSGCKDLTSIKIPSSVNSIGKRAFYNCKSLTSIVLPSSIRFIEDYLFCGCIGLTSITVPNLVNTIGEAAFSGCTGLKSITIPSTVASIRIFAFLGCTDLTSINIDAANINYSSLDGVIFNKAKTSLILCPVSKKGDYIIPSSVKSIGENAFISCIGLNSITIPNSVTSIGNYAFANCSGLTSLNIPNSVNSIGNSLFSNSTSLMSVDVDSSNSNYSSIDGVLFDKAKTRLIFYPIGKIGSYSIPISVTSIDDNAFFGCEGLSSVIIPNSVKSIGVTAFCKCIGLKTITVDATIPPILDTSTFICNDKSIPLYIPIGSLDLYKNSIGWKDFTNIIGLISAVVDPIDKYYTVSIANRTIQLSNVFGKLISVYEVSGRKIFENSKAENNEEIHLENQGIYIIAIEGLKKKVIIY